MANVPNSKRGKTELDALIAEFAERFRDKRTPEEAEDDLIRIMEREYEEEKRAVAERNAPFAFPHIPQSLYKKAAEQQDELTDVERQLLLSRGDVVGKALAQPSSLTEEELHMVLWRPPPGVVRRNVEIVSSGALSTASQLIAKALADPASLNEEEETLLQQNFHRLDRGATVSDTLKRTFDWFNSPPGWREAEILHYSQDWKKALILIIEQQRLPERKAKEKALQDAKLAKRQAADEAKRKADMAEFAVIMEAMSVMTAKEKDEYHRMDRAEMKRSRDENRAIFQKSRDGALTKEEHRALSDTNSAQSKVAREKKIAWCRRIVESHRTTAGVGAQEPKAGPGH